MPLTILTILLYLGIGMVELQREVPEHLRITSVEPPLVPNATYVRSYNNLVLYEVLQNLAEHFDFTYSVHPPKDLRYGALINGSFDGMVLQLQKREVDMGVSSITLNDERFRVIDFCDPIFIDVTGILVSYPKEAEKLGATVEPFQPWVWAGIIGSSIVVWLSLSHLPFRAEKRRRSPPTTGEFAIYTLGCLVSQGPEFYMKGSAIRILFGVWCLIGLILVSVYNSILVSFLTVVRFKPTIESIEELAASNDVLHITMKSTVIDAMMLKATKGTYKILGDKFRQHPETLVANERVAMEMVATGKYAFTHTKKVLQYALKEDYKAHGRCRFTLAKHDFYWRVLGIALQKGSPLKSPFDRQILNLKRYGFTEYWHRRFLPRPEPCRVPDKTFSKNPVISVRNMSSALILYAVGLLISTLTFIVEKIIHERQSKVVAAYNAK